MSQNHRLNINFGLVLGLLLSSSPLLAAPKQNVWVYASVYKEYIAPLEAAFEKLNPTIDVQVFQAGSEKIQAKVEAELVAKKLQADIILVSDPFWGRDLASRGLTHVRKGKNEPVLTNYNSLMVMIVHRTVSEAQRPKSFADLTKPEFKGQLVMGSPLESGSTFSTVAVLSEKLGWDYFKGLATNKMVSAGGNSAVIQKVESGEKKVGIVLLENALASMKRGSPIDVVYPSEGGIVIPSVQVIFKDSPRKDLAEKFGDFVLSDEGQKILISGYMYSSSNKLPAPPDAMPFTMASKGSPEWTPEFTSKIAKASKEIKKKFAALLLD